MLKLRVICRKVGSLPVPSILAVQSILEKIANQFLDLAQDSFSQKAEDPSQYAFCYQLLEEQVCSGLPFPDKNAIQQARVLQGKALRRMAGVSEEFETRSWSKYTDETAKHFCDLAAYAKARGGAPEDHEKMFKILDVNGIGLVCVTDIAPMLEIILRTEAEEKREAVK